MYEKVSQYGTDQIIQIHGFWSLKNWTNPSIGKNPIEKGNFIKDLEVVDYVSEYKKGWFLKNFVLLIHLLTVCVCAAY